GCASVFLNGHFAIEKQGRVSLTVTDGATPEAVQVERLTIGASHVNAFAGINGPASNPGALGLSLTDVDFALALMKVAAPAAPAAATHLRRSAARTASGGSASIIGDDRLTAAARS